MMKQYTLVKPFRIIGNVYFVGCKECSSHLIATEEGLILIDTGDTGCGDNIRASIETLGFHTEEIRYILHSHGHYDHTYATAELLPYAPLAKTYLSSLDERYLSGLFTPDSDYTDGGTVALGSTEIHTIFTPGHTEGAYSFFFDVTERGVTYRAAMFGGAGPRQLRKDYMHRPDRDIWYGMRGEFFRSIDRLLKERVDVPLGNHTWHNHTLEKGKAMAEGTEQNPFICPDEWRTFLIESRNALSQIIESESRTHFINYAHRGAPAYCPENTFLSFYVGMYMGANGIETDVHKTKDGTLILFHDDTLMRTTGKEGKPEDYTYEELSTFLVTGYGLSDKIPTLEDFLIHFGERDITFAIELKGEGCEEGVADLIIKYGLQRKTVVTSFHLDYIQKIKAYQPAIRVAYLTENITDRLLEELRLMHADELCPRGNVITRPLVQKWHHLGFNVRAWGIADEDMMRNVFEMGVDGMTVNFPDKLTAYIREKGR